MDNSYRNAKKTAARIFETKKRAALHPNGVKRNLKRAAMTLVSSRLAELDDQILQSTKKRLYLPAC